MSPWPRPALPTLSLLLALLLLSVAPDHAAPPPPTRVDLVRIRIVSSPTGARVKTPQMLVGTTPLDLRVRRGADFDVKLQLDGYRSVVKRIVAEQDMVIELDLQPAPPPPRPPARAQQERLMCLLCADNW